MTICSKASGEWTMTRDVLTASILLCAALTSALSANLADRAPFEVGQQWTYRHTGPRPGSIEPDPIDGERILQVIRHDPNSGLWIIEERYTNSPEMIGRLHVDPNGMLVAIEVEGDKGQPALLQYDPPIPYERYDLDIGQKTTIETTLQMESPEIAIPMRLEIERLADETVETDAGIFEACQHYETTSHSTFDIKIGKIPMVEQRRRWYHPQTNGLVKETYHKDPIKFLTWSRAGYDASSVLAAFGVEPISQPARTTPTFDPNASRNPHATASPQAQASHNTPVAIVLTLLAVAFAFSGFIAIHHGVMKRRRRA